jgi:hypothetical protein
MLPVWTFWHGWRQGVLETAVSKNGVGVRLTDERWTHITEEHCELAGLRIEVLETVANPSRVLAGSEGELLALRELSPGKHLVVVYREFKDDGFIITAFLTTKIKALNRRTQLWPR